MSIKWKMNRWLLAFTAVLLFILIMTTSGITACHRQAAAACNGRPQTVSVTWGVVCSYHCF